MANIAKRIEKGGCREEDKNRKLSKLGKETNKENYAVNRSTIIT